MTVHHLLISPKDSWAQMAFKFCCISVPITRR